MLCRYLAIDGVAPRAKMNQQRSRRFKGAKERSIKATESKLLCAELAAAGKPVPAEEQEAGFDSNVITPGTPFMDRLARWLQYYVQLRLSSSPAWRDVKVILSDASVPGEGEHKIMDHIRRTGGEDERHAVCGQDADLMFLSLALHAPRVYVLRERVNTGRGKTTGPPRLQYLSAQRLRHCLVRDPGINGLCTTQLDPRNKLSRFERDDERLVSEHRVAPPPQVHRRCRQRRACGPLRMLAHAAPPRCRPPCALP